MIELVWTNKTWIGNNEPDRYIYEYSGDIVNFDIHDDETVGSFTAYYVDLGGAINAGEHLFDVFYAHSQGLCWYAEQLFDLNTMEFSYDVHDALCESMITDLNLLIIEHIELTPDSRGHGLGLQVIRHLMERLGQGVGVHCIYPKPLQFVEGYENTSRQWRNSMKMDSYTASRDSGIQKLANYYAQLGFEPLPDTDLMVRAGASPLPDIDDEWEDEWEGEYGDSESSDIGDFEISADELHSASEQAKKPAIINYLVCPFVPEDQESLLSPEGEPLMVNYSELAWSKLAGELQQNLQDLKLPKSIKVYVGNDAMDLFDIQRFSLKTLEEDEHYNPLEIAAQYYSNATMSDFRAGVSKVPGKMDQLHLNPSTKGKRPPVAAFFISAKFANFTQVVDYLGTVTETLFGTPDAPQLFGQGDTLGPSSMPETLSQWLRYDVGALYSDQCLAVRLPTTFKD